MINEAITSTDAIRTDVAKVEEQKVFMGMIVQAGLARATEPKVALQDGCRGMDLNLILLMINGIYRLAGRVRTAPGIKTVAECAWHRSYPGELPVEGRGCVTKGCAMRVVRERRGLARAKLKNR